MKYVSLHVYVPEELQALLDALAQEQRTTLSSVVREVLAQHVGRPDLAANPLPGRPRTDASARSNGRALAKV